MPQTRSVSKAILKIDTDLWGDESDLTEPDSSDDEAEETREQEKDREQPAAPTNPQKSAASQTSQPLQTHTSTPNAQPGPSRATRPSTQRATRQSRTVKAAQKHSYLSQSMKNDYGVETVYKWMKRNQIELNPDYQRDVVWNDQKQMHLIDSLHHNYPIPPVICGLTETETGGKFRICIDGKQRLTSIRKFLDGEIAYKDSITNKKLWWTNPPGAKRKLVSEVWRSDFESKSISVIDYRDLLPEQEREIFQRVQLGVSLTPAERLQAINGVHADLLRRIRNELTNTNVFHGFADWGRNRGKEFQTLAQIAFLIKSYNTNKVNATIPEPTQARLESWLSGEGGNLDQLRISMQAAFDIFCRLVHDETHGRVITGRNIGPLELVMTLYLINVYKRKLTDRGLASAIDQMRQYIRSKNKDTKFSTKPYKDAMEFIIKQIPKLQFVQILGEIVAADMPPLDPELLKAPIEEPAPPKAKKRSHSVSTAAEAATEDDIPLRSLIAKKPRVAGTRRKATVKPNAYAADDDSDADSEAAVVQRPPKPRSTTARTSTTKVGKATGVGASPAATRVRRTARKKVPEDAAPPPSSGRVQVAKSSVHPSTVNRSRTAQGGPESTLHNTPGNSGAPTNVSVPDAHSCESAASSSTLTTPLPLPLPSWASQPSIHAPAVPLGPSTSSSSTSIASSGGRLANLRAAMGSKAPVPNKVYEEPPSIAHKLPTPPMMAEEPQVKSTAFHNSYLSVDPSQQSSNVSAAPGASTPQRKYSNFKFNKTNSTGTDGPPQASHRQPNPALPASEDEVYRQFRAMTACFATVAPGTAMVPSSGRDMRLLRGPPPGTLAATRAPSNANGGGPMLVPAQWHETQWATPVPIDTGAKRARSASPQRLANAQALKRRPTAPVAKQPTQDPRLRAPPPPY